MLLEVRAETTGQTQWPYDLALDAHDDPADAVSRVYAKSVDAAVATDADTIGLRTALRFDPVPSLTIYTSTFNTSTNWFAIEWPTHPTVFKLQRATRLGSNVNWQTVTNDTGGPNASFQRYFFPVESAEPTAFYRLIWEGGGSPQPLPPAEALAQPTQPPPKE